MLIISFVAEVPTEQRLKVTRLSLLYSNWNNEFQEVGMRDILASTSANGRICFLNISIGPTTKTGAIMNIIISSFLPFVFYEGCTCVVFSQ